MNNLLVKTSGLALAENNSVKTLMFLHGWGMNSQVWEPIRETLESQYHLLWVDLPGHGFNRDIEASNLEQMVDLIAEIIPANTHLIAWSLGGLVAQALSHKLSQITPTRIKSITLVTSTPRFSQGIGQDWQHAMSADILNRFADNLKQDTDKTLKGFIALQFLGVKNGKQAQNDLINHILYSRTDLDLADKDSNSFSNINKRVVNTNERESKSTAEAKVVIKVVSKDTIKGGGVIFNDPRTESAPASLPTTQSSNIPKQQALDVGLAILMHADLRHLKETCPEHWIFAEYDRLIPKEVINDLICLRPNAEITLLEKSGHAPFITHTDIFLKRVTDFIEALD